MDIVEPSLSGTVSHLLTTITSAAPSATALSAMRKSCSVAPITASTTSAQTSARLIARSARSTDSSSVPFSPLATFARLRMPAVSIRLKRRPSLSVTSVSIASVVVPLALCTMLRTSPARQFSRLLFPTLGRPTIATRSGRSASGASARISCSRSGAAGRRATSASSSSPTPVEEMALTAMGSAPPIS